MIVGFIILFLSVMDFAGPESAALCCAAAAELHDNWRSCGLPFSTPSLIPSSACPHQIKHHGSCSWPDCIGLMQRQDASSVIWTRVVLRTPRRSGVNPKAQELNLIHLSRKDPSASTPCQLESHLCAPVIPRLSTLVGKTVVTTTLVRLHVSC